MIGYLEGIPKVQTDFVIVIANGVGYQVWTTSSVLLQLQQVDTCQLFIYTHVTENSLDLYGFKEQAEKELFILLLNISGIGPKTALHISSLGADAITNAVQNAEVSTFSTVPRVGKKMAQKIIIELKSKLGDLKELNLGPVSQVHQDVITAATSLGFSEDQVQKVLQTIETENQNSNQILQQVLKEIGKS